jgi:hypothetical protein
MFVAWLLYLCCRKIARWCEIASSIAVPERCSSNKLGTGENITHKGQNFWNSPGVVWNKKKHAGRLPEFNCSRSARPPPSARPALNGRSSRSAAFSTRAGEIWRSTKSLGDFNPSFTLPGRWAQESDGAIEHILLKMSPHQWHVAYC